MNEYLLNPFVHLFQPPWEEQQHRQPSGARRRGSLCPWLLPYGSTERCCAARQTTTPLQCCGARLLTGGVPAKQAHTDTHTGIYPHKFTHDTWAEPLLVSLRKFRGSSSLHAADLRYSRGIDLIWQAVSSFTGTKEFACARERSAT